MLVEIQENYKSDIKKKQTLLGNLKAYAVLRAWHGLLFCRIELAGVKLQPEIVDFLHLVSKSWNRGAQDQTGS